MGIINEADKPELKKMLDDMGEAVQLIVFSKENCIFCKETLEICQELAEVGGKLSTQHYTLENNREEAERYGVDKAPAIIVEGPQSNGIRFYGVPAGFEFTSLVEGILDASNNSTKLAPATKEALASLDRAIHIQVFVTPTCPYCPRMVRLAHMFATVSTRIRADAVQSPEFPDMAIRYKVMGVPATIINDVKSFDGAQSEQTLLKKILEK